MKESEKNYIFWRQSLNSHERKVLANAGIKNPKKMLDIPIIVMMNLNQFGYYCLLDLVFAMLKRFRSTKELYKNIAMKTDQDLLDQKYPAYEAYMKDPDRLYLNIDEALYAMGYDTNEKIAKITFRELLLIPGVRYGIVKSIVRVIYDAYYKNFRQPITWIEDYDDLMYATEIFFTEPKEH